MTIRRYVATMQIRGARILLTGASGGLGEAIARELASKGAHLVLTARRAEVLEALAADINAEVLVADLADRADQDRVCEAAENCDAVIANAGIDREPGLSPDRVEVLDRVLEVNLRAPMVLAQRYASSRIASGKQGAIVFMGHWRACRATRAPACTAPPSSACVAIRSRCPRNSKGPG